MHLAVPQDPHLVSTTHPSPNPSPSQPAIPTLVTSPPSITYCTVSNQSLDVDSSTSCNHSEIDPDAEDHDHRCEAGKLCTHTIVETEVESSGLSGPRAAPCMPTIVVEKEPDPNSMADARIVILGAQKVGKSAVTVRFLTKRYIGEYESNIDLLYRQTVVQNDVPIYMEVLDSNSQVNMVKSTLIMLRLKKFLG
ncbi:uncharacterized protein [Amphiura filiformis]|uniref:uncharacterized protein n=1 Tax=Amphiura filiformis TaxID=82378 RepID=UPI003B222853